MEAGFCMDAVDTVAKRLSHYPADCPGVRTFRTDAVAFILDRGADYAFRHASPTCTGYSRGTAGVPGRFDKYDRLIPAVRDALRTVGGPYIIENVEDAGPELDHPLMLCWTHFYQPGRVIDSDGTPLYMERHRLFESNVDLWPANLCTHPPRMQCAGAYSGAREDKDEAKERKGGYTPKSPRVLGQLLGIDWMNKRELQLSIPPVYTTFLGEQVIQHLEAEAAA